MPHRRIELLAVLTLALASSPGLAAWNSFEECVIRRIQGAQNDVYASAVIRQCRSDKTLDNASQSAASLGVKSANECLLKFGREIASPLGAKAFGMACNSLFAPPPPAPAPAAAPAPAPMPPPASDKARQAEIASQEAIAIINSHPKFSNLFLMIARSLRTHGELDAETKKQVDACLAAFERSQANPNCRAFTIMLKAALRDGLIAVQDGTPVRSIPNYGDLIVRLAQMSCRLRPDQVALARSLVFNELQTHRPDENYLRVAGCLTFY